MRRLLLKTLFCVAFITVALSSAFSVGDDLYGFTWKQLTAAINKGGLANQKIYYILSFDDESGAGRNVAVLSDSEPGWRVTVLHRIPDALHVQWQSEKLSYDFAVSSPSHLEIGYIGDEQVVKFSGCAAHMCGGLDGVQGALLYSPKSKQVFFAHYQYDGEKPIGSFGSLTFSKNADEPANERYKAELQKTMKAILHQ
jgi:hypothetical protein